jgi:NAD(P)-dependent dehydrogenase (short-subunit alcohol dehydrogenase family)
MLPHMASSGWTAADIPDQAGRTVLITGANSGLGLRASQALAAKGARVLMACRNPAKAAAALDEVKAVASADAVVETVALDLADLASVRDAAEHVAGAVAALDVLLNNAGIMAVPYGRTADGFELQLGTNHLGHFALTGLLLPVLHRAPAPRVVTVSSMAHKIGKIRFGDLMSERRYNRWVAYGQTKLANLLFMHELGRRAAAAGSPLVSAAAHPGYASTHLQSAGGIAWANRFFAQSDTAGAWPEELAATMPDVQSGDYFGPGGLFEQRGHPKRVKGNSRSLDAAVAARLWDVSAELTKVDFTFP